MFHFRASPIALLLAVLALSTIASSGCTTQSACVRLPSATATPSTTAAPSATAAPATANALPDLADTWLFRCCDGAATWVGMLTLVQEQRTLHGAWLTDGDSHGSYVEGRIDGARILLWRRWRTGKVLHEQAYELALDAQGLHLNGTFREPAFDAAPHSVQLERGFVSQPRVVEPPPVQPTLTPIGTEKRGPARDPKRPCDCALVCYCGGIPPGPEHYEEAARCGSSCTCRVCPPLP